MPGFLSHRQKRPFELVGFLFLILRWASPGVRAATFWRVMSELKTGLGLLNRYSKYAVTDHHGTNVSFLEMGLAAVPSGSGRACTVLHGLLTVIWGHSA